MNRQEVTSYKIHVLELCKTLQNSKSNQNFWLFSGQQAMVMLRFWLNTQGNKATGNGLERALRKCDREDIINKCIFNVELVTDESEKHVAEEALDMVSITGSSRAKGHFLNHEYTGIPRFTLLMWGHTKNRGSKNRLNRGYLVALKGRKKG